MIHYQVEDIDIWVAELPTDMPKREAERVAKEEMILHVCGEDAVLEYDDKGKPSLKGRCISISHDSKHLAMAFASHKVGIDMEMIQERIVRLQEKFLDKQMQAQCANDVRELTRCWCAKEAIYKVMGTWDSILTKSGTVFEGRVGEYTLRLFTVWEDEDEMIVVATK